MLYIDEEGGQSQAVNRWYQSPPVLCEGIAKSMVVEKKKKTARFSFTVNGDDDGDDTDVEGGEEEEKEEEEEEESTPPTPVDLSGKRILVRDGLTNGMELLHKRKGKRYPKLDKNTRHHYPCNVLPSTFIEAIARRTRYRQLSMDVEAPLEMFVKALLRTSSCLRKAIMSVKVERIKTNFFPKAICKPGKSKRQGTTIYVSDSKDAPLESFQPDVEQNVYIHQGVLSYDKVLKLLRVKLSVVSTQSADGSDYVVRPFNPESDRRSRRGRSQVDRLESIFMRKWRQEGDGDSSNDEDSDVFF